MKENLVIYHYPCADGFTSAYIAFLYFGKQAEYVPATYNSKDRLPNFKNRNVYLLDFSYKQEQVRKITKEANKVVILDHHQSAQEDLTPLFEEGVIKGVFDMKRSGAGITWDWFFPNEPRPAIVNYIEDRDLWKFALSMSKEVSMAVFSHKYIFEDWEALFNTPIERLKSDGEAILRKHLKDVEEISEQATTLNIAGYDVPAVNANYTYGSDVASLLSEETPFAAYFWVNKENEYVFGLRSNKGNPNAADVAKLAEKYNGGGHKHASGFKLKSLSDL